MYGLKWTRNQQSMSSYSAVALKHSTGIKTNLMCGSIGKTWALAVTFIAAAFTSFDAPGAQITTNWVAYNDHRPGTLIPVGQAPPAPTTVNWGTSVRATVYDMRVGPGGNLTNFVNGQQLPATMTMSPMGVPDDFGECSEPLTNTPAYAIFHGV